MKRKIIIVLLLLMYTSGVCVAGEIGVLEVFDDFNIIDIQYYESSNGSELNADEALLFVYDVLMDDNINISIETKNADYQEMIKFMIEKKVLLPSEGSILSSKISELDFIKFLCRLVGSNNEFDLDSKKR